MAKLNAEILDVIACPICKGKLQYDKKSQVFVCNFDKLKFPVKDGMPIMLESEASSFKEN